MTIVIAGGSGYIGTLLSQKLLSLGNRVVVVDIKAPRITHSELFFIQCDITTNPLPYDVLEKTDAVINLAGRPIATKWTEKSKKDIATSRTESTRHIIETIKNTKNKPSCFVCASAVGYYGDTGEDECDESCGRGLGFLSDVVEDWEKIAEKATEYGVRTVCVRTAPVLGHGGFLSELTKSAKFGFLLKMKKSDFWMSWIHEEDIINTYLFAIETSTLQGVFNACSPEPVRHSSFMKSLGSAMHRKVIGTLPKFLARKIFGEFFEEITKNQKVTPKKLIDKGFVFSYPSLAGALNQIFKK
jgi:uncharacterized protein (TIGR01777 family)